MGKWCKRGKGTGKLSGQGSFTGGGNGSLISVGADGRGGRVKVIRPLNQSSLVRVKKLVLHFLPDAYMHTTIAEWRMMLVCELNGIAIVLLDNLWHLNFTKWLHVVLEWSNSIEIGKKY